MEPETEEVPFEESQNCCVCCEGTWETNNQIVFCDGCNMAVHVECYGNPLLKEVPDGDWFCQQCQAKANDSPCVLCSHTGGAMKRTTDYQWVHVCCALWIPEVFFVDGVGREPIDCFQLPKSKFASVCFYCDRRGACTVCSESGCGRVFHISCGLKNNVLLEYKTSKGKGQKDIIVSFCGSCSAEARKMQRWKVKFYAKES